MLTLPLFSWFSVGFSNDLCISFDDKFTSFFYIMYFMVYLHSQFNSFHRLILCLKFEIINTEVVRLIEIIDRIQVCYFIIYIWHALGVLHSLDLGLL